MTATYCRVCKKWFDKSDGVCSCGTRRPAFNSALASQRFANLLNDKAARAAAEG